MFKVVGAYLDRLKEMDIAEELNTMKTQQKEKYEREHRELSKEMEKLAKDIKTLSDKLPDAINGTYYFSEEELAQMIRERKERLKKLQLEMENAQDKILKASVTYGDMEKFINIAPDWKAVFAEADVPAKRMLLASLIERIDVKDEDISIKFRIRLDDFMRGNGDKEVRGTTGSDTIPYTPYST